MIGYDKKALHFLIKLSVLQHNIISQNNKAYLAMEPALLSAFGVAGGGAL